MTNRRLSPLTFERAVFVLFGVSGFAGIIYESVWTHYLKLFLGHAALAQSVVLILFMGGLAIGSAIAARASLNRFDLLALYIAVEFVLGAIGWCFHPVYLVATNWGYTELLPSMNALWTANTVKHALAAVLILPQSVLLGMTFPLITVGLMRRRPETRARSLATLYFVNSLGAAVGVLASAFVFVEWVGLPGTIRIAASLNIALACALTVLVRYAVDTNANPVDHSKQAAGDRGPKILLVVALLTGTASFIYEIVWIRLLNMVLGASTHSFEIMLSAFILGLALGSYWIRRRITSIKQPLVLLGLIQIAMAVLALCTLMFYDFSFALMAAALATFAKSTLGYAGFLIVSHGIALLIMLPATICAGMTLPLATRALLDRGYGERAVGDIYAINTVGAIIGIVVAIHLLIPALTLKGALIVGVGIDFAVGVGLLWWFANEGERRDYAIVASVAGGFMVLTAIVVDLDPRKMAAGVFRTGVVSIGDESAVVWRRDGKTSSVSVITVDNTLRVLATNGKPDASIESRPDKPASRDEATQVLTGLLPVALHPTAERAALIGIGSGMSTHAMLANPSLQRVDTIEIEAAMIEGARQFLPSVGRAFDDPRSHLHVNDGRSFFALQREPYDIIVSEPSNPWVSGVAGLFSTEYYELVRRHLSNDGIFVQWLQLYETDLELVASVFKALAGVFSDFVVYDADGGNLLIVSSASGRVPDINAGVVDNPEAEQLLKRVGIRTADELRLRRIGDRQLLMPLFASAMLPANSDFYPVLDRGSAKRRYLNSDATEILKLANAPVDLNLLGLRRPITDPDIEHHNEHRSSRVASAARALITAQWVIERDEAVAHFLDGDLQHQVRAIKSKSSCQGIEPDFRRRDLIAIAAATLPHLSAEPAMRLLEALESTVCPQNHAWLAMLRSIVKREAGAIRAQVRELFDTSREDEFVEHYLVNVIVHTYLLESDARAAKEYWRTLPADVRARLGADAALRLMLAHAGWDVARARSLVVP